MTRTIAVAGPAHSVACDSLDHWLAPVKPCSKLGFSCLLRYSTSHNIVSAHQSSMILHVYLLRTGAHQTWSCCRQGMRLSDVGRPRQHLILRVASISLILSGVLDAFTHCGTQQLGSAAAHWCSLGDAPSNVKDKFQPPAVSGPCMDKAPGLVLKAQKSVFITKKLKWGLSW